MSRQPGSPEWFRALRPRPAPRARLFCFPYAGGSDFVFREWPRHLAPDVEIHAALLPGRASRISAEPLTSISAMAERLAEGVRPLLDRPFAFYGHSMGAFIAFEVARRLRSGAGAGPAHLFVGGCRAPQLPDPDPPIHGLPDEEFVANLRRLNGTPAEVFEHPELMRLMLPLLRADFEAVESYVYEPGEPLACRVSAYGGLRDTLVAREQLEGWREQAAGDFSLSVFDGDHFFLQQSAPQLLRALDRELARLVG
ncbi:MAG TPA: alpha/beta fold hydrolase [Pyrinomonadaceae bacterium]|jgi:medium-chain acyl-[acyl-carrier-protein] hydrolase